MGLLLLLPNCLVLTAGTSKTTWFPLLDSICKKCKKGRYWDDKTYPEVVFPLLCFRLGIRAGHHQDLGYGGPKEIQRNVGALLQRRASHCICDRRGRPKAFHDSTQGIAGITGIILHHLLGLSFLDLSNFGCFRTSQRLLMFLCWFCWTKPTYTTLSPRIRLFSRTGIFVFAIKNLFCSASDYQATWSQFNKESGRLVLLGVLQEHYQYRQGLLLRKKIHLFSLQFKSFFFLSFLIARLSNGLSREQRKRAKKFDWACCIFIERRVLHEKLGHTNHMHVFIWRNKTCFQLWLFRANTCKMAGQPPSPRSGRGRSYRRSIATALSFVTCTCSQGRLN